MVGAGKAGFRSVWQKLKALKILKTVKERVVRVLKSSIYNRFKRFRTGFPQPVKKKSAKLNRPTTASNHPSIGPVCSARIQHYLLKISTKN
ncbi:hypothetical protein BpHYR1_041478 [Brachionus plicatilis]|uniref:Uncharacterized protein n=1 Tax=Brachionus plicatilis TaxID=10195 RepID=A0A3M7RWI5_BRAPC|nr:hypothetical protein BpHYR1_041478 [Brachionus plicatilis]